MRCTAFLLFLVLFVVAVRGEPKFIRRRDGLYAHPDDNTPQCFTTPSGHRLCIGNEYAARNTDALLAERVTHVVSAIGRYEGMREDLFRYHVENFGDAHYVADLEQVLDRTAMFIVQALVSSPSTVVFVHCAVGISRSATIVLDFLLRTNQYHTYEEALEALHAVRPIVQPNAFFERALRDRDAKTRAASARKFLWVLLAVAAVVLAALVAASVARLLNRPTAVLKQNKKDH